LRFCAAHSVSTRPLAMSKDKMDASSPPSDNAGVIVSPSVADQAGTAIAGIHSSKDHSKIDEIIQQRLKQIEREKEQQMLLFIKNPNDSLENATLRKFKKLPIIKSSTNKKPRVAKSPRIPKGLSHTSPTDESAIAAGTLNASEPPMDQAQKHFFTLSPHPQLPPPPLPPPMHFFSNEPLFPRTVSTDMIVLATAAAAVEAAEARAAEEEARSAVNGTNGGR
jgi:hypothetical protein